MSDLIAVLPYFPQPVWETSWIRIQAWDVFVAVGFLTGASIAARLSRSRGEDGAVVLDLAPWLLLGGFTGAHLVHVFFYEPEILSKNPIQLLYIWSGLSSFGGFFGAAITLPLFFRRRRLSFWRFADPLAVGMAVAWTIARVGCFVAHDHKGSLSTFPLAVDFPGGARHDLGLYEAILSAFLALICAWAFNRKLPTGSVAALLCLLYAPVRFGMDFLRAEDISGADSRYAGLTPAQYGCVALFVFSVYAWRRAQAAATAESVSD